MHRRKTSFAEAVRWMTPPQQSSFVVAGAHSFGLDNELNDLQHLVQLARQRPWAALLLIEASPLLASQLEAIGISEGCRLCGIETPGPPTPSPTGCGTANLSNISAAGRRGGRRGLPS